MASTSFGKAPSGASLAALLLLVAVLAGSFAPRAKAQAFKLRVDNHLNDTNDVDCTITEPVVAGTEETFFVPAGGSNNVTIQATQPLSSKFEVEVYGNGPLGRGTPNHSSGIRGKIYSTGADELQRAASLIGYLFVLVGPCGNATEPGLQLDGYTMPPAASGANVFVNSTCAQLKN